MSLAQNLVKNSKTRGFREIFVCALKVDAARSAPSTRLQRQGSEEFRFDRMRVTALYVCCDAIGGQSVSSAREEDDITGSASFVSALRHSRKSRAIQRVCPRIKMGQACAHPYFFIADTSCNQQPTGAFSFALTTCWLAACPSIVHPLPFCCAVKAPSEVRASSI